MAAVAGLLHDQVRIPPRFPWTQAEVYFIYFINKGKYVASCLTAPYYIVLRQDKDTDTI